MNRTSFFLSACLMLLIGFPLMAQQDPAPKSQQSNPKRTAPRKQQTYPPEIADAKVEVYKTVDDVKLNAWIFQPKSDPQIKKRPAVVFFFGGGWRSGSPNQFVPHSRHLAKKGVVGIVVDYRVSSRHDVKMTACIADAKSAIRWTRENADRLGIDPDRIAAGGGSAGGHLAAATALVSGFDEASENQDVSSKPNALILFNPALVLAPVEGQSFFDEARVERFKNVAGVASEKVSPYHGIESNAPPAIILHGRNDKTVPYKTAEIFAERMRQKGNRCELVGFPGQGHGFFNAHRKGEEYYQKTVKQMDEFLTSIGFLDVGRLSTEPRKSKALTRITAIYAEPFSVSHWARGHGHDFGDTHWR